MDGIGGLLVWCSWYGAFRMVLLVWRSWYGALRTVLLEGLLEQCFALRGVFLEVSWNVAPALLEDS